MDTRRRMRRLAAMLAPAVAAAALSGCGTSGSGFNKADARYASEALRQHAQTIHLLDLTLGRAGLDPQISALGDEVRPRLFAEANADQRFLKSWHQSVPQTFLEHNDDPQGPRWDASIPGVLSNAQVAALESAKGSHFAKSWLKALIDHERGAVTLAQTAAKSGESEKLAAFAGRDLTFHEGLVRRLTKLASG